jgi:hypothetical protein
MVVSYWLLDAAGGKPHFLLGMNRGFLLALLVWREESRDLNRLHVYEQRFPIGYLM